MNVVCRYRVLIVIHVGVDAIFIGACLCHSLRAFEKLSNNHHKVQYVAWLTPRDFLSSGFCLSPSLSCVFLMLALLGRHFTHGSKPAVTGFCLVLSVTLDKNDSPLPISPISAEAFALTGPALNQWR